jgi:hypothetical protein
MLVMNRGMVRFTCFAVLGLLIALVGMPAAAAPAAVDRSEAAGTGYWTVLLRVVALVWAEATAGDDGSSAAADGGTADAGPQADPIG